MNIIEAIKKRWSCRAFLDKPVTQEQIATLLEAARYAPSGVNHQPWHVAVLTGKVKEQLSDAIIKERHAGVDQHPDYHYYPDEWKEPYISRRKACGIALYNAKHIKREDTELRKKVWEDNYRFFDAPIGLIVYLEKRLQTGSWFDLGMFLQNIMLAALDLGLATCPQAALAEYPDIVRKHLGIPENFSIACGVSLGYPDMNDEVNQYRLEREPLDAFVKWY